MELGLCRWVDTAMELARDELHLHFAYSVQISDPELLDQYRSLLSEAELTRMSRFKFKRHRHEYLVTRALVRTTLSRYFDVRPAEWRFTANRYGKPGIAAPETALPVRFNLSHSNGLIVCGVILGHDIGVDIEDMQRATNSAFVDLSRYFSAGEIDSLRSLSEAQRRRRFFEYWTLKEAYIKARGKGLSIPLHDFGFTFNGNNLIGFDTNPGLGDDASKWRFWRMQIDGRYLIAVATESTHNALVLSAINSVPLKGFKPVALDIL